MPIQRKFYINLLDDYERRVKFLGKGYHRWEACSRDEVPDELDKKMKSLQKTVIKYGKYIETMEKISLF